ncbi:MAG TPA: nucleotide exchange factor GrpE [Saprospiraceae bacterium]|nr:nucleotide exchange factor GrpE [Saprospiraceae bacterium]
MTGKKKQETEDIINDDIQDDIQEENHKAESKKKAGKNEVQEQLNELKDKYLRLIAEFDNYKKRTARERIELEQSAAKKTLLAIIPSIDDFERAKKIADEENSPEPFSEGVKLVFNKLNSAVKSLGLNPIDSTGETFNPELHEAITEIDMGENMKGKVIDTVERGYKLNDHIIKYAKVVVGK